MSSAKYAPVPTTAQPPAIIMPQDLDSMIVESEKGPRGNSSSCQHSCGHCESNGNGHPPEHRGCHNGRLRRILLPALIAFVILSGLFALSCVRGHGADAAAWGVETLFSRQNNGAGSGSDNGVFIDRKYYLIVIFVGLFLVVILGIMLSAWCCKSSFQNPLCCPCYLCACCGGLACLQCIGCGLCAEGLSEM